MMFGSAVVWAAGFFYLTGLPFLGVVLCAKVFGQGKEFNKNQASEQLTPSNPPI
jgi:hypothetical protein